MEMKKKICVLTGTRAEYGLLKPILKRILASPKLELHLIAVGMHLSEEFGYTVKEIEKDGFTIDAKLDTLNRGDTGKGMAEYIGETIVKIAEILDGIEPDIMLILGDRSEMLAGVIAASCMNIVIAHIHGGESSGSVDESFRNAITKLAHVHFAATERSKQGIIGMGEESSRVVVVGAPGLDDILIDPVDAKTITEKHGLNLNEPKILIVQHSVVTEFEDAARQIKETLDAIVDLKYQTILIYPNADPGGRRMIKVIEDYVRKYKFIKSFKNLPRDEYLVLMNIADVMVGNSSSGIIEAASFQLPVVNIGTRQKGREKTENVIDVGYNKEQIIKAIKKAVTDKNFKKKIKKAKNPYFKKASSEQIVKILEKTKITTELIQK